MQEIWRSAKRWMFGFPEMEGSQPKKRTIRDLQLPSPPPPRTHPISEGGRVYIRKTTRSLALEFSDLHTLASEFGDLHTFTLGFGGFDYFLSRFFELFWTLASGSLTFTFVRTLLVSISSPTKALSLLHQPKATANWCGQCSKSNRLSANMCLPFPPSFHSSSDGPMHEQAILSSSCPSPGSPLSAALAQTVCWTHTTKHSPIHLHLLTASPPCRLHCHHRPPCCITAHSTHSLTDIATVVYQGFQAPICCVSSFCFFLVFEL